MTKSTSQVLQEARALIERGWCQGALHKGPRDARRHCLVGAVNLSTGRHSERLRAFDALGAVLPVWLSSPVISFNFTGFNDLPATTKADVLALFDRALEEVAK